MAELIHPEIINASVMPPVALIGLEERIVTMDFFHVHVHKNVNVNAAVMHVYGRYDFFILWTSDGEGICEELYVMKEESLKVDEALSRVHNKSKEPKELGKGHVTVQVEESISSDGGGENLG